MKRSASLVLFLAILSVFSGYMLSGASWIGRVGMSLFYQEYTFLKTWWKGALLVFAVWMFLYGVQLLVQRMASRAVAKMVNFAAIAAAFIGLYLTYDDFRHTTSHRWMGERFHIGAYLFWLGWIIISIYLLMEKKNLEAAKHKVGMDV
jgi:O-antigen/teichoic acid export membrane protein